VKSEKKTYITPSLSKVGSPEPSGGGENGMVETQLGEKVMGSGATSTNTLPGLARRKNYTPQSERKNLLVSLLKGSKRKKLFRESSKSKMGRERFLANTRANNEAPQKPPERADKEKIRPISSV